ncbi:MAG: hypothetical protein Q4G49_04750 [Paracoccus sp. (in: a-proteobacteria)]|nr:hypothetical protein [Paracoccus sp. (in: a-proteobacteria)]
MIRLTHFALILILVLTSTALGSARGQARVAGQIVICTGSATITVAVDDQGQPITRTHFCPDMALSLLAAVGGQQDAAPVPSAHRIDWIVTRYDAQSRDIPAHNARDPPVNLS